MLGDPLFQKSKELHYCLEGLYFALTMGSATATQHMIQDNTLTWASSQVSTHVTCYQVDYGLFEVINCVYRALAAIPNSDELDIRL